MSLDYESSSTHPAPGEGKAYRIVLRLLVGYFVLSILTLPFLDALWLGELPLLALIQLPKTAWAEWLRTEVVMEIIKAVGLSRGSYSPDAIMARPYALALAYLIPVGIFLVVLWLRTRLARPYRRWVIILLIAAAMDFCLTLHFAGGPGLSIY